MKVLFTMSETTVSWQHGTRGTPQHVDLGTIEDLGVFAIGSGFERIGVEFIRYAPKKAPARRVAKQLYAS